MAAWIAFTEVYPDKPRKTRIWNVITKDGVVILGQISWFGRWRCYGFYPSPDTVYERQCLHDIADFCELQTRSHRLTVKKEHP